MNFLLIFIYIQLIRALPAPFNFSIWDDNNQTNFLLLQNNNLNTSRLPRVLNFFPVPVEEECLSTDGRRKGVCMNAYECRIQSGSSKGQCALGFGVCCIFTATCSQEIFNNITYFVNPDFPDLSKNISECTVKVKKIDPEISQLRLDFIHFNLGQPNRKTGDCDEDIFVLSAQGTNRDLKLCGLNSGQHVYYDIEMVDEIVSIMMNFTQKIVPRLWELRIIQIPFTQRAPSGCLQYHEGERGIIQTMNFADNGRHLADQDYNICMRQELGMCSIAYEPCDDNSFRIGPNNNNNNTTTNDIEEIGSGDGLGRDLGNGDNCLDKIVLPCDSEDLLLAGDGNGEGLGTGSCNLVHCGGSLCPSGEKPCRIESSATPFSVGVHFEKSAREQAADDNLGMCLIYEQLPCS